VMGLNMKKYICFLALSLLSLSSLYARRNKKASMPQEVCGNNEKRCKDLKDSCQCYCAYKPGPRDKVKGDKPVFVNDDPSEIYCYCKQRDIDKHRADQEAAEERPMVNEG